MMGWRLTISRAAIMVGAACCALPSRAGLEVACERVEYARLKDASRRDLVDGYCDAMLTADTNGKIADSSSKAFHEYLALGHLSRAEQVKGEAAAARSARSVCLRVARDAADMLRKRFPARGQPTCSR